MHLSLKSLTEMSRSTLGFLNGFVQIALGCLLRSDCCYVCFFASAASLLGVAACARCSEDTAVQTHSKSSE